MPSTLIKFETIHNIRDLGSIRNRDGLKIKDKKLIRSERLCEASIEDMKVLYDFYDLRNVIDFRSDVEFYEKPDTHIEGINYVHCLLEKQATYGVAIDQESIRKRDEYFKKLDVLCREDEFTLAHMCEFYRNVAISDYSLKGYKRFLDIIMNTDDCVLWHCSLGRDRAGIATTILLEIFDVENKEIYEEYLETGKFLRPQKFFENTSIYYKYPQKEYLDAFYEGIKEKYGSFDSYLEELGIDRNNKEFLKQKYLEV